MQDADYIDLQNGGREPLFFFMQNGEREHRQRFQQACDMYREFDETFNAGAFTAEDVN
jgi:hypothetical protein